MGESREANAAFEAAANAATLQGAIAADMAPQSQSVVEADWEANVLRK